MPRPPTADRAVRRRGCGIAASALALAVVAACSTGPAEPRAVVTTGASRSVGTAGEVTAAPTGAPPTTAAPATTAAATPSTTTGVSVPPPTSPPVTANGPRPQPVTLVETPLATRRPAGAQRGALVTVSNPAYDQAFVLAVRADELPTVRWAPGWTARPLGTDLQWEPAALAARPRALVGRRWLAYVDETPAAPVDGQPSLGPVDRQLVVLDLTTGRLSTHLELPNQVRWFGASLLALDAGTLALLFDPTPRAEVPPDPAVAEVRDRLAVRRIDLATGRATDVAVPLPPGYTYRTATFDADGAVVVTTTYDEVLRGAVGQPAVLAEPSAVVTAPAVDGVRLDVGAVAPDGSPAAAVRAAEPDPGLLLPRWRLTGPGASLGLHGWSAGRAYVDAWLEDPAAVAGAVSGPAVYDRAGDRWDWVIAADSPVARTTSGAGYTVVGTVAA